MIEATHSRTKWEKSSAQDGAGIRKETTAIRNRATLPRGVMIAPARPKPFSRNADSVTLVKTYHSLRVARNARCSVHLRFMAPVFSQIIVNANANRRRPMVCCATLHLSAARLERKTVSIGARRRRGAGAALFRRQGRLGEGSFCIRHREEKSDVRRHPGGGIARGRGFPRSLSLGYQWITFISSLGEGILTSCAESWLVACNR